MSVMLVAAVAPSAALAKPRLGVSPTHLKFRQPFWTSAEKPVTVTNTGSTTAVVRLQPVVQPDPIDFGGGAPSPCVTSVDNVLASGERCTLLVRFFADPSFRRSTATLVATAIDPATGEALASRVLKVDARGFESTLAQLVDLGQRDAIRAWAAGRSIATLNADVAALDAARRERLAEVVLDSNATGASRDLMLRAMRAILADSDLGFYAEIWSYTFIELTGDGFFGTCNHLFLSPDAFGGLSERDARNVLAHESLHSFNCVNGGPIGSLDEGAALWIIKAGFGEPLLPGESWAEATYGTKLYHKVFFGNPNLPLVAPLQPTPKLLELYGWLSDHDPSQLPWNSTERLVACFDRYFADLDRNVDFVTVWLPAVDAATALMLADPECRPL
jgi:hypothetical protein